MTSLRQRMVDMPHPAYQPACRVRKNAESKRFGPVFSRRLIRALGMFSSVLSSH
jgi:hypothetical protein